MPVLSRHGSAGATVQSTCRLVVVSLLVGLPLAWLLPIGAAPAPPSTRATVERAGHKGYTETIPGSKVRFKMVAIPGGSYWMGSSAGERARSGDEGPLHPVRVAPFWMGMCEVTWDEYDVFRR